MRRGGYILHEASGGSPQVILIASGSEVQLALEARERLEGEGLATRVVSLMSWRLFSDQDEAYQKHVLPDAVRVRVSIEAGTTFGWGRWVGLEGRSVGIDHFGASAPWERLYEEFGLTAEAVVAAAREALAGI